MDAFTKFTREIKANRGMTTVIVVLLAITALTCLGIVFQTWPCGHPDSRQHLHGFAYFEENWWPPDLNSDELVYSPYGYSRVYSGEIVYLVYGKFIGLFFAAVQRLIGDTTLDLVNTRPICGPSLPLYGLLNSILFILTLSFLFYHGFKHKIFTILGFTLLSIPQVTYLFAYANSDAWALAISILLFLFVYVQEGTWVKKPGKFIVVGLMTGVLLASKSSLWVSFSYIYLLVGWDLLQGFRKSQFKPSSFGLNLGLLLVSAFLIAAPSKIIYPLTQEDYSLAVEETFETRAREDLRPSNPTASGYRLKSKGVPFTFILMDKIWRTYTIKSFYGLFGYMTVLSPEPAYIMAASLAILMVTLTVYTLIHRWGQVPFRSRMLTILAPGVIVINILASMYVSWVRDHQAQGRYLFASIIPLALLLGVTYEVEERKLRVARWVVWGLLLLLNLYILWDIVIINPELG
jgi:hypothetical protein